MKHQQKNMMRVLFGQICLPNVPHTLQKSSGIEQQPLDCPSADALMKQFASLKIGKGIEALVYSVAELADAAQCERFEVYLDTRKLQKMSLLHLRMADYQGPALCFYLPGKLMSFFSRAFESREMASIL